MSNPLDNRQILFPSLEFLNKFKSTRHTSPPPPHLNHRHRHRNIAHKKTCSQKEMSSFLTSNVLLPTKYLKRMMTWKKKHENKRLFVVLFPFFCCHCYRFASLFPFFPIRYQKDGWKQKHTREREREKQQQKAIKIIAEDIIKQMATFY